MLFNLLFFPPFEEVLEICWIRETNCLSCASECIRHSCSRVRNGGGLIRQHTLHGQITCLWDIPEIRDPVDLRYSCSLGDPLLTKSPYLACPQPWRSSVGAAAWSRLLPALSPVCICRCIDLVSGGGVPSRASTSLAQSPSSSKCRQVQLSGAANPWSLLLCTMMGTVD